MDNTNLVVSFTDIPNAIIQQIGKPLDLKDLSRFSQVNKKVRVAAIPLLNKNYEYLTYCKRIQEIDKSIKKKKVSIGPAVGYQFLTNDWPKGLVNSIFQR
ncbi:MAG: hypothetical protein K0S74_876 [Chlamydiales bacterium]|jgi:hypothetical protein|nr:hypothetical protein [Chlamydiales bacterium]